jgi:hypothetical protein
LPRFLAGLNAGVTAHQLDESILNYTNDKLSLYTEHKGAGELTLVFLHYGSISSQQQTSERVTRRGRLLSNGLQCIEEAI